MTPLGKLQTRCERCRATAVRGNKTEAGKARENRKARSDKGKAANKRFKMSDKGKAAAKRSKTSDKGKACAKRYKTGEAGKAAVKRFGTSEKGKAAAKRFKTSEAGKAERKRYHESKAGRAERKRFKASEKGKASAHRANTTPSARIGKKISKLCRDAGIDSVSAMEATGCASTAELRAHFESTFEPWMNWSNQGAHKVGGNSEAWQIGHRLAKAFYDDGNPADIQRCWNKANLFAQDADENHALSVKMPDDAVLDNLRALDLLPSAWHGIVPPAAQRAEMERLARLNVAFR